MKDLVVKSQLPVINSNYDVVRTSLEGLLEKYKGIVVIEETLKDCKEDAKKLSKLKKEIDTYRKEIKNELNAPVKIFEGQCKELVAMIELVEKPIKDGIKVFDDKKRVEKAEKVKGLIDQAVKDHELNDKYKQWLNVLPEYLNVSTSIKSIKEDINKRAATLFQEQENERLAKEYLISTVKATIENANKRIETKLVYEDFEEFIKSGVNIARIIEEINKRAEIIYKAENKPVAPQIEEVNEEVQEAPKEIKQEAPAYELKQEVVKEIKPAKEETPTTVILEIADVRTKLIALRKFIDDNNIEFKTLKDEDILDKAREINEKRNGF